MDPAARPTSGGPGGLAARAGPDDPATRALHEWFARPITVVEGANQRLAGLLRSQLAIETVGGLLEHYPYRDRYRPIGAAAPIAALTEGEAATVVGHIARWEVVRPRGKRLVIAKATVVDEDGDEIEAPFFNQQWRPRHTPEGTRVAVSGAVQRYGRRQALQLGKPRLTPLAEGEDFAVEGGLEPTYPATERLPSWRIARLVAAALEATPPLPDFLPEELRWRRGLLTLDEALRGIHRPRTLAEARAARERLIYDELLCLQVGLQRRRERLTATAAGLPQAPIRGGQAATLLERLPFGPTGAQQRAFTEIGDDLTGSSPMHRLLQGDVGSGKTLVAVWTLLCALDHQRQAALMAPTEVLAEQHLRTVSELLAPLGVNVPDGPRVELLTGSTPMRRRRGLLAELAAGEPMLLIGTHALLEEEVRLPELGAVVVDEQHRFGVEHRARLRDKRSDERSPDVLVMTATPIPRSLALTVYGDLEVTTLDELPPGRQPVVTTVLPRDSERRAGLYRYIRERAAAGERAYVVCPLVEASEAIDARSVQETYTELAEEIFPDLSVGLVHGRMGQAERDAVMEAFRHGAVQVLAATTVIEVGVDVPEATIMVIEDADRFGLSQLHQLRGRVGRGAGRSYCVLFTAGEEASDRLEAVAATGDGFRLAERDLALRGEGSLFDTRQSGLPDLRLATLVRDQQWVARCREDAQRLVVDDPDLDAFPALRAEVVRRYGEERLAALDAG